MPNSIAVHRLTYGWSNTSPIIDLSEFNIERGQTLFVQGDSGSGKSTLLNLLAGVLTPDKGEIQLLEQPFSTRNTNQRDRFRADHIGYIFQQFNLIPYLTAVQNVLLAGQISAVRRQNAINEHGSLEVAARYWLTQLNIPENLFSVAAGQLSVGQQQRVAAARALLGKPEIILADEPTSALDKKNVQHFMQMLLHEVHEIHSTLIFVSHDTELAQYFDQCLELPTPTVEPA